MIPDYQSLMRLVLECAASGPRQISDVVQDISDRLNLSEAERAQMLPSGKQTVIANRVHWARSYLKQAGLVHNTQRGWYELTQRGQATLADPNIVVNNKYLQQFDDYQEFMSRRKDGTTDDAANGSPETLTPDDETSTPDERLQEAHRKLQTALAANLLDNVRAASPAFFEQLIVDLLIAMGYGGTSDDAGRALGQSGDNGIDGVIDQDPLGVDQIYLQAKRYAAHVTVGSGEIRDFFGALSLKKASKGIFVTTSRFSPSATQTARDLGLRIVMIDGAHLAKLMIAYNVGCRDKDILHIKQIDEGYFEETAG
ncbi:restriction endonuclease [Roseovarius nubinhibens]|uniref:Restriction endonuclease n=1 Tax=Roseovarius nubinhibens TaxID=314263 RepID=A0A348WJD8_9RHOB|nr:restriction endonuclease [Roseovarius nubinhibens]|tara:strand:+ start:769 stop:1704 length:936 start_codon:yes stop_codon:yes gene_type:complete